MSLSAGAAGTSGWDAAGAGGGVLGPIGTSVIREERGWKDLFCLAW